jgi:hypothetical protein
VTPITVVGGPWPERIGCQGRIVTDELDPMRYPRAGRLPHEVIVLLDDDPLADWHASPESDSDRGWSCVYNRDDIRLTL